VSLLEGVFYIVGVASLGLGWLFSTFATCHLYGHKASYIDYTKIPFLNWAADSAAQDYTIVNLVLLPLWTIVDGRRREMKIPWIFFVMSLFTSLAFSMAMYLAFVERQTATTERFLFPLTRHSRSCSGNEGDARTTVTASATKVEAVNRYRIVRPSSWTRTEWPMNSGCRSPCVKSPPVPAEHQF